MTRDDIASILLEQVAFYRTKYAFSLCGYVLMPDHGHFLLIADENQITGILRDVKSMVSRRVIDLWKSSETGQHDLQRFRRSEEVRRGHRWSLWQPGNWTVILEESRLLESRLDYMHQNPVRAGLVLRETDWRWSSARWYATRESVGVKIDMDWVN